MHKFIFFLLFFYAALVSFAQSTGATLSGVITNSLGAPIPNIEIQIKNESTGFTDKTVTNSKGKYIFNEIPLGGPYTVKASSPEIGEKVKSGYMLNQGEIVAVDISTSDLKDIEVVSKSAKSKMENIGSATSISLREMEKLPVNGRNFTSLSDLSPLSSGENIAGQLGSSTNYTIDGMNAKNPTSSGPTTSRTGAPYSISIEAVREFAVVTNQYDVKYGRSGGGTISAVTKQGSNKLSGSVFSYSRADWLSSPYNIVGNKRNNEFSTYQFGVSLGGPIIKNKLHFFFVWDHQIDSRPLLIADIRSANDELRYNITNATLDKIVDIARRNYGIGGKPQYGSFPKQRYSDAFFLRLDWQINKKNLLTLRNNLTTDLNKLGIEDNTAINLYESAGNDYSIDNNLLLTLRTSINSKLTNELKAQHLYTFQDSYPGDDLPRSNIPRVIIEDVTSVINGSYRRTNVQIGGHRFAQENFTNHVFQLTDNLYLKTDRINYTFGVDFMYTHARSLYGSEVNGRFHVRSGTRKEPVSGADVPDFTNYENGTAYRFFREVPLFDDPAVYANIVNAGIYGQLQTSLAKGLDVVVGLRLDYAYYPSSPLNQMVLDEIGVRTDRSLSSFIPQPRLQLTWDVDNKKKNVLRLGAGIFSSDINNYITINNLTFDGKHFGTLDVYQGAPSAYLTPYRRDPKSIPTLASSQISTINTYGENATTPIVYKANLSYTHFFSSKLRTTVTAYATLGRNNYVYIDKNMVKDPFFRLAEEGNRGVFVPLSTINPLNGASDWKEGRISKRLGRTLEMNSIGEVNNFAIVVDAKYLYYKDGEISFSYTWSDTRDNTSFNGNVANTSTLVFPVREDPRDLSKMTYSDNQFRHKVVFYATSPTFWGIVVAVRYSGIGGTRYSLLSGANTNGDFVTSKNDLAFIFDRNNPNVPLNVRDGLQKLIDNPNASQSLKDYINEYSGQIAERNGGVNDFYGVLDIRITKRFKLYKNHALEISLDLFNALNLLNKEWGRNESLTSQNLYALQTPGFDAANRRFNYSVNNTGVITPSGNPYQFQIGIRYAF